MSEAQDLCTRWELSQLLAPARVQSRLAQATMRLLGGLLEENWPEPLELVILDDKLFTVRRNSQGHPRDVWPVMGLAALKELLRKEVVQVFGLSAKQAEYLDRLPFVPRSLEPRPN